MSVSVFDHPLMSSLLGDEEIAGFFSVEAEIESMVRFEIHLAQAQAKAGLVSKSSAQKIARIFHDWSPDQEALKDGFATDGVVVPALVRQMRAALDEETGRHLHLGATSQDVVDTGLILRLKAATDILADRLNVVGQQLEMLRDEYGDREIMGVTRMQYALPLKLRHRIESWLEPLARCQLRLEEIQPRLFCVQLGGAVGDNAKLGGNADVVAVSLADELGLQASSRHWQNTRDTLAEYASWLSLVTGSLGKLGQDIALMAQNPVGAVRLAGGGGSSAMPHKQNPVLAESLVTLARFNATQVSAMHHAQIHELERSGAAWTLEWMVLPQMLVATGASARNASNLLGTITDMGS